MTSTPDNSGLLFEYLLRLGDDRLVLGHRLSEWCGHGPILEEDIALANIALDCLGQASHFLELAGRIEGRGRSADDLSYFREAIDFRNLMLLEQPNGDFAFSMARQFMFDTYSVLLLDELQQTKHKDMAGIAAKALKESSYHLRHSREWILRMGDGTDESHVRIQRAVDDLWTYTSEIFTMDEIDQRLLQEGMAVDLAPLSKAWSEEIQKTLSQATLTLPEPGQYQSSGSRRGIHTEHLGHLLSEMQILARSYPDVAW